MLPGCMRTWSYEHKRANSKKWSSVQMQGMPGSMQPYWKWSKGAMAPFRRHCNLLASRASVRADAQEHGKFSVLPCAVDTISDSRALMRSIYILYLPQKCASCVGVEVYFIEYAPLLPSGCCAAWNVRGECSPGCRLQACDLH